MKSLEVQLSFRNARNVIITDSVPYLEKQCLFQEKEDHFHEVKFHTDFSDRHYHEFCGKTSGAIDVGDGKHVHFLKDFTEEKDEHKHRFQAATLIDSPTDFKCKPT